MEFVLIVSSLHAKLFNPWEQLDSPLTTVADPGFGQGGATNFFPRFCRRSEVKYSEQSEQYNISI